MSDIKPCSNFAFLQDHDPLLWQLAHAAERAFVSDPNTTLIKLRQLAEAMAQHIAAVSGVAFDAQTTQADLLYKLQQVIGLEPVIRDLFHSLRIEGNKATHQFKTQHKEALEGLKLARALAIWFYQAFGKPKANFKAGAFVAPPDPSAQLNALQRELEQLRGELSQTQIKLVDHEKFNQLLAQEKAEYEALALEMDAEARAVAQQVKEQETELQQLRQQYAQQIQQVGEDTRQQTDGTLSQQRRHISQQVKHASKTLTLDEELTRILIDQQLQAAGWEADSQQLSYQQGSRPEQGVNRAIAEWPTRDKGRKGYADYVLFIGLTPVAVVEAKREMLNVAGAIPQAERYSRGFAVTPPMTGAWLLAQHAQAWDDGQARRYQIPFVYSCNGRPYVPQLAEQSGTWFRDVRAPHNVSRALQQFHTPDGLQDLLQRNQQRAEQLLQQEDFAYLKLREYQQQAIKAVEAALAQQRQRCLLAMATGTGKTRTIIGLMYRLLKSERFKRILFLVDRTALGQQALDAFHEAPLEQNYSLAKIYNITSLTELSAALETRVQVATVQAMVRRVLMSDNAPPVDQFDCIIVDEAHRGYTLDQEMTEGELATRDVNQYLSSYRRVLEYFDAVKIGLTATPAKHTSEIFGKPIFTYSYREAVAEDWLIDHEPPIRYQTLLSQQGIHFAKGESVSSINTRTGEVELSELDDELNFEVEDFNRRVINESFNQVICQQLAQELDPFGEEKTLIFCATDLHADMVVRLLGAAFGELHGEQYNQAAVAKITGSSDKVDQLIRQYKNERYPSIAVTVDLLTTGIDVPKICHLVFMRRVKSRILYEQMIGRATRRCDDIGKTVFRIYDPVDIYASLQEVSTMKPLVKDPNITLAQLIGEMQDEALWAKASAQPASDSAGETQAQVVLSQLSQKLMRVLRKATHVAERKPALKQKLAELQQVWGVAPEKLAQHLQQLGTQGAAQFVRQRPQFMQHLQTVSELLGSEYRPVISEHEDQLISREQSYGAHQKPADYLEQFQQFVREQLNQSVALAVVVNKPRDLTRAQLKEVRLLLDQHGFSESHLQAAQRAQSNQEIAASIIGYIRQAALGEALLPFQQRVDLAMQKIYAQQAWTEVQRKWLGRLAKQLVHEVVLDVDWLDACFANHGGVKQIDKILGGQFDAVLGELGEVLWQVG